MQPHAGGFTDINSNIVKSGLACACVTAHAKSKKRVFALSSQRMKTAERSEIKSCHCLYVCVHYLHGLNTLSVFLSPVRLCSRLFLSGFFGPSCSQIEGTIQARWITNSGQFVKSQFDP